MFLIKVCSFFTPMNVEKMFDKNYKKMYCARLVCVLLPYLAFLRIHQAFLAIFHYRPHEIKI